MARFRCPCYKDGMPTKKSHFSPRRHGEHRDQNSMKFLLCLLCVLCVSVVNKISRAETPVYQDKSQPLEARVEDLLGKLTPDEKIDMISGINGFDVRPIERLGVPKMHMSDGP